MSTILFKSDLFNVEPGEELQPGLYGLQLARWLEGRLKERGHGVERIAEDWGWCLMLQRRPFMLWVGCGNAQEESLDGEQTPQGSDLTWQCFAVAEGGWIASLRGRIDKDEAVRKLDRELMEILLSEPRIQIV